MDLTTVALVRKAFYRLTGVREGDPTLTRRGEAATEVVDGALTRGSRAAQRWMLKQGYMGWRTLSDPLVWTTQADGTQRAPLPDDFLRAFGDEKRSALVEADGDRWGQQLTADRGHRRGDAYWIEGLGHVYVARGATPPAGLLLDYHYRHPPWTGAAGWEDLFEIDFPLEARPLIVAHAALSAKNEAWLPGDESMPAKIAAALREAQTDAMDVARATKQARRFRPVKRMGTRW
jgi:hypothetical protein